MERPRVRRLELAHELPLLRNYRLQRRSGLLGGLSSIGGLGERDGLVRHERGLRTPLVPSSLRFADDPAPAEPSRIPVPATISSWGRAPVRLGIFRSEDFSSRLICSRSASHLIRPKSDLTPFCSHPVLSSVFSPPLSYCFSLVLCTSRKTQKNCSLSQGLNLIARGVGMLKAPSLPLSPET